MGVKDENHTPPAGIFYPAFFTSTRRGSANVATDGAKMSEIDGDGLRFTPIPPRVKLTVKVTVVAW